MVSNPGLSASSYLARVWYIYSENPCAGFVFAISLDSAWCFAMCG